MATYIIGVPIEAQEYFEIEADSEAEALENYLNGESDGLVNGEIAGAPWIHDVVEDEG